MGYWPTENKTCLVWYDHSTETGKPGYFSFDELQEVVSLNLLVQLDDGAIYLMSRK